MIKLQLFPFTPFADEAISIDDLLIKGDFDDSFYSIFNGKIGADALAGDDKIIGVLNATLDTDDFIGLDGILNLGLLDAGLGDDVIQGIVNVEAGNESAFFANGIFNPIGNGDSNGPESAIYGDLGDDSIIGAVYAEFGDRAFETSLNGINGGYIDTGKGHDVVIGEVVMKGGADIEVAMDGIDDAYIFTGPGNDIVKGIASGEVGYQGDLSNNDGIDDAYIKTGRGSDLVTGVTIQKVGNFGEAGANDGVDDAYVATGAGSDAVIGFTEVSVGDGVDDALGNDGIDGSTIKTGGGSDLVLGATIVRGGVDSDISFADGIDGGDEDNESRIVTGKDDDAVIGVGIALSAGGEYGRAEDISGIDDIDIITGKGDDLVLGFAFIDNLTPGFDAPEAAFGDGIRGSFSSELGEEPMGNRIIAGAGDDTVIGIGAGLRGDEGTSEGIDRMEILLGAGNDFVFARGGLDEDAEGVMGYVPDSVTAVTDDYEPEYEDVSRGVKDVRIEGGRGDDIFDLHSGTGYVNGGKDVDLLILDGESTDYSFFEFGELEGLIVDDVKPTKIYEGEMTELNVAKIELFQFDDGTFTFDQLFELV